MFKDFANISDFFLSFDISLRVIFFKSQVVFWLRIVFFFEPLPFSFYVTTQSHVTDHFCQQFYSFIIDQWSLVIRCLYYESFYDVSRCIVIFCQVIFLVANNCFQVHQSSITCHFLLIPRVILWHVISLFFRRMSILSIIINHVTFSVHIVSESFLWHVLSFFGRMPFFHLTLDIGYFNFVSVIIHFITYYSSS